MSDTLVRMTDDTDRTEAADSTNRIRLIIDTEDALRRAVRARAANEGVSPSDIVNELIRKHLGPEIEEARQFINATKRRKKT